MNRGNASAKARLVKLCHGALVAALYVALTYLSAMVGLDKGAIQIRFSEALVVLAFLSSAAIPGLTVGCFLANLLTGGSALDLILGPIATLIGALGAYLIGRTNNKRTARWICTLPNIAANTVIVSLICLFSYSAPGSEARSVLPIYFATVGAGELLSCGVLGTAFLLTSEKGLRKILQ